MTAICVPGFVVALLMAGRKFAPLGSSGDRQVHHFGILVVDDTRDWSCFRIRRTMENPAAYQLPFPKRGVRQVSRGAGLMWGCLPGAARHFLVTSILIRDLLVETGSAGAAANVILFFERSVEPGDLNAVVVSVDGQAKGFRVNHPKRIIKLVKGGGSNA
jgi:hypothetical protein